MDRLSKSVTFLFILLYCSNISSQVVKLYEQEKWVDSLLQSMTLKEKIGQLFILPAYSNRGEEHKQEVKKLIQNQHIGSLIFFQDDAIKQANLTNYFQKKSKIPLLIGIDAEWGLKMRLKNTHGFPWNMTLGAIQNNDLIEEFGEQVAEHLKLIGAHINFAPVVDINTNPNNPIIGNRSFGEDRENVANKAIAFTKGLQSKQVIACAKHFPGHGDTSKDSHLELPTIDFLKKRIDSIELYPYKKLFKKGIASVMTAHLNVPNLTETAALPASLSKNVVTSLLKNELGFDGLIITDAMNMKGAANYDSPEEVNLAAFLAGNDMINMPLEIYKTIKIFKKSVKNGTISKERLNHSLRKILRAKYWAGLQNYQPIDTTNLAFKLNSIENERLHRKLLKNAITLVKNEEEVFPIRNLAQQKIAYVPIGNYLGNNFLNTLQKYTSVDFVNDGNHEVLIEKLKPYNLVIIGYHRSDKNPWKDYKFKKSEIELISKIAKEKRVILDVFASPYAMLQLHNHKDFEAILLSYQNSKWSQEISAQMIFGALEVKGKLPVKANESFLAGHGLFSDAIGRLTYDMPEEVGIDRLKLSEIDSLASVVIKEKMAPGMQILVARKGAVVYHKSFGHFTYEKEQLVNNTNLYDVASLTKVMVTLPLIMELEEQGKVNLNNRLSKLIPELKKSNKDKITLKQALSHYGQLKAWIPFHIKTLDPQTNKPSLDYYRSSKTNEFSIKIADSLYLRSDYKDSIFTRIKEVDQLPEKTYKYSDLTFHLLKKYLEKYYQQDLNTLSQNHFFKPLGANNTTYLPLNKFKKNQIVPTEQDDNYRNQLLQGYVQDAGAAMENGIGGHAGLFANANDVAKMLQMLLQDGNYGGEHYFKKKTIDKFNRRYYKKQDVRRGLGFDKPQLSSEENNTCGCVSDKSFGHSGYTGTYMWADPKTELIYIFLSNRVHPSANNKSLLKNNIRTDIQRIVQESLVD